MRLKDIEDKVKNAIDEGFKDRQRLDMLIHALFMEDFVLKEAKTAHRDSLVEYKDKILAYLDSEIERIDKRIKALDELTSISQLQKMGY